MFEFYIKHIGNQDHAPPPHLDQSKHFEHNCIFVNDILYQNVLFVVFLCKGGGGLGEAVKKLKNQ